MHLEAHTDSPNDLYVRRVGQTRVGLNTKAVSKLRRAGEETSLREPEEGEYPNKLFIHEGERAELIAMGPEFPTNGFVCVYVDQEIAIVSSQDVDPVQLTLKRPKTTIEKISFRLFEDA